MEQAWYDSQVAAAAIGAMSSTVGSLSGNWENKKLMREQMDWQTDEREAAQEYNNQQRIYAQEYQTAEREAQNKYAENMYNKYSSPQALAEQYAAAGLNPNLAIEGGAGSVGASSGSSGGAPSGSHVGTPSTSVPYVDPNFIQSGFQNMANAFKSIAEAKKAGVDTSLLEKQVEWYDKLQKQQFESQEIEKLHKQLAYDLYKKFGAKEAEAKLAHIGADIDKMRQTVANMKTDKEFTEMKKFNYLRELDSVIALRESQVRVNDASGRELSSRVSLNHANASLARAQAAHEEDKHKLTKLMQDTEKARPAQIRAATRLDSLNGDMIAIANEIKNATKEEEKERLRGEFLSAAKAAEKEMLYLENEIKDWHDAENGDVLAGLITGIRLNIRDFSPIVGVNLGAFRGSSTSTSNVHSTGAYSSSSTSSSYNVNHNYHY